MFSNRLQNIRTVRLMSILTRLSDVIWNYRKLKVGRKKELGQTVFFLVV